jgi:hypothetical protein
MSEFPQQPPKSLTAATFNLTELAAQLPQSANGTHAVTPSSSKPGVKRQQTYVRTTDVAREKEKKKGDSKKSRVGEKIKKRLSMRSVA